jgi:TP901 family phage tail tape measure protein
MNDLKKVIELAIRVKDEASASLRRTSKNLQDLSGQFNKAEKSSDRLKKEAQGVSRAMDKGSRSTDRFSQSTKKLSKNATAAGKSMTDMLKSGRGLVEALGMVAMAAGSLLFPVIEASAFERKMSEVKAISGAVGEEYAAMTAEARRLGAVTEFTANQAAEGLKFLTMAGLDAVEAMEALEGTLQLAQAGGMELGRAADIATNILTGFGFEVKELQRVNDVLTQTFTNTNSTLEELGYAMAYVAPVAAGLGAEFEDLTAAMGKLHSAGIKGSMAGTTLRGVMTRLAAPVSKTAEVMDRLGQRIEGGSLKILDAQGNFVGFVELVRQLEEAGATTSEIMEMLGQRSGPGLAALLSQGSEALREMTDLNRTSAGRAAEIAKVMHENVVGSWRAMKSAMSDTAITVGNVVLPVVDALLKGITVLAQELGELMRKFPILTKLVLGAVTAVAALSAGFLVLQGTVATVAWTIGSMATVVTAIATKFGLVAASTSKWMATLQGLWAILSTSVKWLFTLTGALTSLAAVLTATFFGLALSERFRAWASDLEFFGVRVGDVGALIAGYLIKFFESPVLLVWNAWVTLRDGLPAILGEIMQMIGGFGGKIADGLGKIPGLNKLLGLDKDGSKIKRFFEDLEGAGRELSEQYQKRAQESYRALEAELSTGSQVISLVKAEMAERRKRAPIENAYNKMRERAVELETQLADAAADVAKKYKDQLAPLEKSTQVALQRVTQTSQALETSVNAGEEILKNLGQSIERHISDAWKRATSDDVAMPYLDQLHKLETETRLSSERLVSEAQKIGNEMGSAQASSIMGVMGQIDSLYGQQLASYEKFLRAQENTHGMSQEAIAQHEKAIQRKLTQYAEEVFTKKQEYYQRATDALKSELERSLEAEKSYANEIKRLSEQIELAKLSGEEKIRALRRQAMSEEEVMADKRLEYAELMRRANQLMATDAEGAQEAAKKAQEVAGDLVKTTADGTKDVSEAISKTEDAQNLINKALERQKTAAEEAMQAQKNHSASMKETLQGLESEYDRIQGKIETGLKAKVEIDVENFNRQLEDISQKRDIYVNAIVEFEDLSAQLKVLKDKIKGEQEAVSIPIKAEGEAEIKAIFDSIGERRAELQEKIIVSAKEDPSLNSVHETLARIAGVAGELGAKNAAPEISLKGGPETKIALEAIESQMNGMDERQITVETVISDDSKNDVEELSSAIDAMNKPVSIKLTINGLSRAFTEVKRLVNEIAKLKDKTVTITTRYVSSGQKPEGRRTGGRLPGYGGGDRRPILAEDGEWFIRKEAVRKYGDSFMAAINSMTLPRFNVGGRVGAVATSIQKVAPNIVNNGPQLNDFGRVVLDTGKVSFPALMKNDVMEEVTNHLAKIKRFST